MISLVGKRLEFLKHVVPSLARIGAVVDPGDAGDDIVLRTVGDCSRPAHWV